MACGTQIITGISDDEIGLALAAADIDGPKRIIEESGGAGLWNLTLIFDPCGAATDQVTETSFGSAGSPQVRQEPAGPATFVAAHLQDAKKVKAAYAVPIAVTLAQSALETGWGRAAPGNAFFGVKAGPGQPSVSFWTHEDEHGQTFLRKLGFRSYPDFQTAALDYGKFLKVNTRYNKAFNFTNDPEQFAREVAAAGYASGAGYATKLISIMRAHGLAQYDGTATPTLTAASTVGQPIPNKKANFAARAALIAIDEWTFFGKQTFDQQGHKDHAGHTEGENGYWQRVGLYWLEGTNTHGLDGRDHGHYWSATFISWVMRQAGADDRFRYSTQHSVYIYQGVRDFLSKRTTAGYWTVRLNEEKPEIGDLVCWSRQAGIDYDHQHGGDYAGHTDVVVEVRDGQISIIGGNVGSSITRRPLALDQNGYLAVTEQGGEPLFALMKCRVG